MGLSPSVTVGGLILLVAIIAGVAIESPENAQQVSIQVAPIIAILLAILRSDYLAAQADKKAAAAAAELKQQTEDKASELKRRQDQTAAELAASQHREAEKTRQTVAASSAVRDDKIEQVKEQIQQTKEQVEQVAKHSNQMKDELVAEVRKASFAAGAKSETDKATGNPDTTPGAGG